MKCSFCGEKSISSLTFLDQGMMSIVYFCEFHTKNEKIFLDSEKNRVIDSKNTQEENPVGDFIKELLSKAKQPNYFDKPYMPDNDFDKDDFSSKKVFKEKKEYIDPEEYKKFEDCEDVEKLEQYLESAVDNEDFEFAINIRNKINKIISEE